MKRVCRSLPFMVASYLLGACSPAENNEAQNSLLIESSISVTNQGVGYVHILGRNVGLTELGWTIQNAKLVEPMSYECERATSDLTEVLAPAEDHTDVPEPSFGLTAFTKSHEWQIRTLSLPSVLFGKGCLLRLTIGDSSLDLREPARYLEIELQEGKFDKLPADFFKATQGSFAVAPVEYLEEFGVYVVRIAMQADSAGLVQAQWPRYAECANGLTSVDLSLMPRATLPHAGAQMLSSKQWGTVAASFKANIPSLKDENCNMKVKINIAERDTTRRYENSLTVHFSELTSIPTGDLTWGGCPQCRLPEIEKGAL